MSDINEKKKLLDPSSITYGDIIGEGGFAVVFKAQLQNKDGTTLQVAAKRLDVPDEKEIEYLSKLIHPNIISYVGYFKEDESLTTAITIVTELAEKGDLRSYLESSSGLLAADLASRWIKEAGRASQYLHHNDVVHRDIKSNNYLISADNTLKLADFGLAKDLDETMSTVSNGTVRLKFASKAMSTLFSTTRWMAPEVIRDHKRSKLSDIYAYAIVIWEILHRLKPFEGLETKYAITTAVCEGKRPEISEECSDRCRWVMENGWHWDYQQRPNIDVIMTMLEADEAQTVSDILEEMKDEANKEKKALESNVYHPEMQSELKKQQEKVENETESHSKQMNDMEELRQRMRAKSKAKKAKKAKTPAT